MEALALGVALRGAAGGGADHGEVAAVLGGEAEASLQPGTLGTPPAAGRDGAGAGEHGDTLHQDQRAGGGGPPPRPTPSIHPAPASGASRARASTKAVGGALGALEAAGKGEIAERMIHLAGSFPRSALRRLRSPDEAVQISLDM